MNTLTAFVCHFAVEVEANYAKHLTEWYHTLGHPGEELAPHTMERILRCLGAWTRGADTVDFASLWPVIQAFIRRGPKAPRTSGILERYHWGTSTAHWREHDWESSE